jgi:hypothetical protein
MGLWAWLSNLGKGHTVKPLDVVLYTRQGCHLCETGYQQLEKAQQRWQFHLSIVDVDTDPALVEQHGDWVPVVVIDGRIRFRGRINEVLLDRMLQAEQRNAPS